MAKANNMTTEETKPEWKMPVPDFEEKGHSYSYQGKKMVGVTRLIKTLVKPFEADEHATRIAKRDNKDKATILAEWHTKGIEAANNGTDVHTHIKQFLAGRINAKIPEELIHWLKWWSVAKATLGLVIAEQAVVDPEWGIAGTLDALFASRKTNTLHTFDWKTGEKRLDGHAFNMLKQPFEDIPETKLNVYSLQVSLYRLILERKDMPCGDGWIMHLGKVGIRPYKAIDFRNRLKHWIEEFEPQKEL